MKALQYLQDSYGLRFFHVSRLWLLLLVVSHLDTSCTDGGRRYSWQLGYHHSGEAGWAHHTALSVVSNPVETLSGTDGSSHIC